MKKKLFSVIVAAVLISTMLTSCTIPNSKIALQYDNQINEDDSFNQNLFYRNDLGTPVCDPKVILITDKDSSEYGYYYLYGTNGTKSFITYRSKDMTSWENVSDLKGFNAFYPADDSFCYDTLWAPEVIYDQEQDIYYMFYSGRNRLIKDGKWMIGVATSDEPYGPFTAIVDDTHNASTPFFDRDKIMETVAAKGRTVSDVWNCIDPHPSIAPDGTKYLYFTRDKAAGVSGTTVWGIKMNSWSDPDYSTLTQLTKTGYYTVDGTEVADYEGTKNTINEGAQVYISKQDDGSYRYYLTLSINGYADKSYSVIQAVSDSPLGSYRKLTEEEGGVLLSTDHMTMDNVSGPGHHSFMTIGDQLFIIYHEHENPVLGGSARDVAFDKVDLIKNNEGEEILYANGPTRSIQPKEEKYSEYKNIASEATITASKGENVEALNDGLLSIYKKIDFVKEFETDKTTTITIDFGEYREITGLMIYNSKNYEKAFPDISNIEFDFRDDEKNYESTAYINNLAFNWKDYKNQYAEDMRSGGSAVAVFNPMYVDKIRITLKLPITRPEDIELLDSDGYIVDQSSVAISEITVLGK